jgi:hypothetical protein
MTYDIQNIISNKFDLNWSTLFSYKNLALKRVQHANVLDLSSVPVLLSSGIKIRYK